MSTGMCRQSVAAEVSVRPPSCSPVLPLAELLDNPRAETFGYPWLGSSFFWSASLMNGQRQPWSKWGQETAGTEFCGDVCFTSCPFPRCYQAGVWMFRP